MAKQTKTKPEIKTGPYDSLRDYMEAIETHGSVIRIDEIDQDNYELTGLMYKLIDKHGWRGAPALIVDKIKVIFRANICFKPSLRADPTQFAKILT